MFNLDSVKAQEIAEYIVKVTGTDTLDKLAELAKIVEVLEEAPQGKRLREICINMQTSYNDSFIAGTTKYRDTMDSLTDLSTYMNKAAANIDDVKTIDAGTEGIQAIEVPSGA